MSLKSSLLLVAFGMLLLKCESQVLVPNSVSDSNQGLSTKSGKMSVVKPDISSDSTCTGKTCLGKMTLDFTLPLEEGATLSFDYVPYGNPNLLPMVGRITIEEVKTIVGLNYEYTHPESTLCYLYSGDWDPRTYGPIDKGDTAKFMSMCHTVQGESPSVTNTGKETFKVRTIKTGEDTKNCKNVPSGDHTIKSAGVPIVSGNGGIAVYSIDPRPLLSVKMCMKLDKTVCSQFNVSSEGKVIVRSSDPLTLTNVNVKSPKALPSGSVAFRYGKTATSNRTILGAAYVTAAGKGMPMVKGSLGEFQTAGFPAEKWDMTYGLSSYDFSDDIPAKFSKTSADDVRETQYCMGVREDVNLNEYDDQTLGVGRVNDFVYITPFAFESPYEIAGVTGTMQATDGREEEYEWFFVGLLIGLAVTAVVGFFAWLFWPTEKAQDCTVPHEKFSSLNRIDTIFNSLEPLGNQFDQYNVKYDPGMIAHETVGKSKEMNLTNYETQTITLTLTSTSYRLSYDTSVGVLRDLKVLNCVLVRYAGGSFCDVTYFYSGPGMMVMVTGNVIWLENSIPMLQGENTRRMSFRSTGVSDVDPRICLVVNGNQTCATAKLSKVIDQTQTLQPDITGGDGFSNDDFRGETTNLITLNPGFLAFMVIDYTVGGILVILMLIMMPRYFTTMVAMMKVTNMIPSAAALSTAPPPALQQLVGWSMIACLAGLVTILALTGRKKWNKKAVVAVTLAVLAVGSSAADISTTTCPQESFKIQSGLIRSNSTLKVYTSNHDMVLRAGEYLGVMDDSSRILIIDVERHCYFIKCASSSGVRCDDDFHFCMTKGSERGPTSRWDGKCDQDRWTREMDFTKKQRTRREAPVDFIGISFSIVEVTNKITRVSKHSLPGDVMLFDGYKWVNENDFPGTSYFFRNGYNISVIPNALPICTADSVSSYNSAGAPGSWATLIYAQGELSPNPLPTGPCTVTAKSNVTWLKPCDGNQYSPNSACMYTKADGPVLGLTTFVTNGPGGQRWGQSSTAFNAGIMKVMKDTYAGNVVTINEDLIFPVNQKLYIFDSAGNYQTHTLPSNLMNGTKLIMPSGTMHYEIVGKMPYGITPGRWNRMLPSWKKLFTFDKETISTIPTGLQGGFMTVFQQDINTKSLVMASLRVNDNRFRYLGGQMTGASAVYWTATDMGWWGEFDVLASGSQSLLFNTDSDAMNGPFTGVYGTPGKSLRASNALDGMTAKLASIRQGSFSLDARMNMTSVVMNGHPLVVSFNLTAELNLIADLDDYEFGSTCNKKPKNGVNVLNKIMELNKMTYSESVTQERNLTKLLCGVGDSCPTMYKSAVMLAGDSAFNYLGNETAHMTDGRNLINHTTSVSSIPVLGPSSYSAHLSGAEGIALFPVYAWHQKCYISGMMIFKSGTTSNSGISKGDLELIQGSFSDQVVVTQHFETIGTLDTSFLSIRDWNETMKQWTTIILFSQTAEDMELVGGSTKISGVYPCTGGAFNQIIVSLSVSTPGVMDPKQKDEFLLQVQRSIQSGLKLTGSYTIDVKSTEWFEMRGVSLQGAAIVSCSGDCTATWSDGVTKCDVTMSSDSSSFSYPKVCESELGMGLMNGRFTNIGIGLGSSECNVFVWLVERNGTTLKQHFAGNCVDGAFVYGMTCNNVGLKIKELGGMGTIRGLSFPLKSRSYTLVYHPLDENLNPCDSSYVRDGNVTIIGGNCAVHTDLGKGGSRLLLMGEVLDSTMGSMLNRKSNGMVERFDSTMTGTPCTTFAQSLNCLFHMNTTAWVFLWLIWGVPILLIVIGKSLHCTLRIVKRNALANGVKMIALKAYETGEITADEKRFIQQMRRTKVIECGVMKAEKCLMKRKEPVESVDWDKIKTIILNMPPAVKQDDKGKAKKCCSIWKKIMPDTKYDDASRLALLGVVTANKEFKEKKVAPRRVRGVGLESF